MWDLKHPLRWCFGVYLLLSLLSPVVSQQSPSSTVGSTSTATSSAPTRSATTVLNATTSAVALNDSVIARARITLGTSTGAFFNFTVPASLYSDEIDTVQVWTSVSLCSGPEIPPYNTSNSTLLESLEMSATEARQATLVGLFISVDDLFQRPGPANVSSLDPSHIGYAQGGWVSLEVDVRQQFVNSSQPIWIGVWPPQDGRGVSNGSYDIQIVTSTVAKMEGVDYTQRPRLEDTDDDSALVTSFNFTSPAPNLTAIVLPTFGQYSLPDADYFNSSFCAIQDAYFQFQANSYLTVNATRTSRATSSTVAGEARTQFHVLGLEPGSNYTLWLAETNLINNDPKMGLTTTLFPSIKFRTKRTPACRLVYDVPFCPNVAYSIPVSPQIESSAALSLVQDFITPIWSNFSTMIDTFPCSDPYFGMYSYVQSCDDCKEAYRDWLCAVAMPRCTDPITESNQSRASQNGTDLTGAPTGYNVDLLPYIVNRNVNGSSPSRQPYIDEILQPGPYGELLPCIYTCYFVTRRCPPLINWACPIWDITAQRDYGTFADSGLEGIGAAENGGAGEDGMRWGGYQRYIATDAFGNAYCNALGVDFLLRQSNSSRSKPGTSTAGLIALLFMSLFTILLSMFAF